MKVRGGNRENVFVLANFQSLSDLNRHKFLKRSIESLVEPRQDNLFTALLSVKVVNQIPVDISTLPQCFTGLVEVLM